MACDQWSTDKATGGAASASSQYSGSYPASKAFDDNTATSSRWMNAYPGSNEWLKYDFGAGVSWEIEKVRCYSYTAYVPTRIVVQGSNDDSWPGTELHDTGTISGWGTSSWYEIEFTNAVAYRYIRLYFPDDSYLALVECEMLICAAYEVETDDDIGLDDAVDAFNLTDGISDQAGLDDAVDAFNLTDSISEGLALQDLISTGIETEISILTQNIGLNDFIDGSIFPGKISDDIGFADYIAGAFEYIDEISDGMGIADQTDALNWTQWLALYGDQIIKRYFFTLTGDADSTTDIEIPISNFQARKRSGYETYLSVTIPDLSYSAQIEARSNGEMILTMAFELNGQIEFEQEFIRTTLDRIDIYEGSKNRSIVLIGYKTQTFENQISVIEHPIYKSSMGGRLLYRFASLDPYVNPGDTCQIGNDEFTVDYVNYQVSDRYSVMEIKEI